MQQLYHTVTIQQTNFNNKTAILNSLLYNNQQLSYNHHTATKLSLYKNKYEQYNNKITMLQQHVKQPTYKYTSTK